MVPGIKPPFGRSIRAPGGGINGRSGSQLGRFVRHSGRSRSSLRCKRLLVGAANMLGVWLRARVSPCWLRQDSEAVFLFSLPQVTRDASAVLSKAAGLVRPGAMPVTRIGMYLSD